MTLRDDEQKYKDVIGTLKGLQKVKAPANFEANLLRRINSENIDEKNPQSRWEKILTPSRWVPSAALAVSTVILLFILNIDNSDTEDPLSMEPKVRQDILETKDISEIPYPARDNIGRQKNKETEDSNIPEFRTERSDTGIQENKGISSFSTAGFLIDKSGLNFRQVNLSKDEKVRLIELKEHFAKILKKKKNN